MQRPLPFLLIVAVGLAARPTRAQDQPKTPEALLQGMAAAYGAVQSYADNDEAIYRNPDGSERLRVTFRIWLARPGHFRIDAEAKAPGSEKSKREVLWTEGAATRTWATDKPVSSHPRVQLIGSRMFGTYAYHVPTLLDESYGAHRRLHELQAPVLVGEEPFEGVDCYRIKGAWEADPYEIWIGKADLLVRRI